MSHRLYYQDSYLKSFKATIQRVDVRDDKWLAILDRTAFYPTSGGQPFDTGALGGVSVVDVVDLEDGSIGHVVERTLEAGREVEAGIDWPRRFDHMQQHTGQHILSAAFERCHHDATVSFHLGAESSTIDLQRELPRDAIVEAANEANRVIWENRPVTIRFASREEALKLPLRKEPGREGQLRLIEVADFDLSACGGTHVNQTGAVGIIAISAWERFKGGMRVHFVCGGRALKSFGTLRDIVADSSRLLSVQSVEIPSAVERLQSEGKDTRRTIKQLQEQLVGHEAARLAREGVANGSATLVAEALDGWDAQGLKNIAAKIAERPSIIAVLTSGGPPSLVAVARSADLSLDASAFVKEIAAAFGGRGGGTKELAQAGGLLAHASAILEDVRKRLRPQT
jgi:alanyl-tRNA synthetase